MAVAEIYINQTAPDEVTMDFSPWVSGLTNPETVHGFAYAQTLDRLGFRHVLDSTDDLPQLRVRGSLEIAHRHLPDLQNCVGAIAILAAQKEKPFAGYNQQRISEILSKLSQAALPELSDMATLPELTFAIAYPLAKELHEKGVYGHLENCKAPWRATEIEQKLQEKKRALFGPGKLYCIPSQPEIAPEEELAQLNSLPDQQSWFARQEEERSLKAEAQAVEFLSSRGFTIMPRLPSGRMTHTVHGGVE